MNVNFSLVSVISQKGLAVCSGWKKGNTASFVCEYKVGTVTETEYVNIYECKGLSKSRM